MKYALLLLALVSTVALAQTPRTATITFTAPTEYTDGAAITSGTAISYRVFQGTKGSTSKTLVGTITSTSTTINSGLQPGETCWQVKTVINGVESVASNEACKTFAFPTPNTVVITVT